MIYENTNSQFQKTLRNLKAILEKAELFAQSKKVEFPVMMNSRLAVDQFPLYRQIQIACDTAKLGASRLTAKEAPPHEDGEMTINQAKSRIDDVIAYLGKLTEQDYQSASTIKITTPRWEGKYLMGNEYVIHHVIPNFYFHITTAYSILRHCGVDVGKHDYLGELPFKK